MKSLERRLNEIENNEANKEPCKIAFQNLNGTYRIGKKTLNESEFKKLEKDNRVIVMAPMEN